jgi:hypothetical protein
MNAPLGADRGFPVLTPASLPRPVSERLELTHSTRIGFELPVPDGVLHVARTSPLVETLASYLVDTALDGALSGPASRSGAIRTSDVTTRTTLLLLRIRMHIEVTRLGVTTELLAEEALVAAYRGRGERAEWLSRDDAEALLGAVPSANMSAPDKQSRLEDALRDVASQQAAIEQLANDQAAAVLNAHVRVRSASRQTGVTYQVRPTLPVDILGLYLLMPQGGVM